MNAFIVTNDKFRDYHRKIEVQPSTNQPEALKREKAWIKQHTISFTFREDEFMPNPDSKLFQKYAYQTYKSYPLIPSDDDDDNDQEESKK